MVPYRFLLSLLLTTSCFALQARPMMSSPAPEGYEVEVEVVSEDIGMLVGALGITDLTGYSCSRLYVVMNNADDFMSSVSGDIINPTYVNTTTEFYQAALGAGTPNGINSLLFAVYPDLQYDSWVTIGLEGVPNALAGEANVSTVQATDNPWLTNFEPGGGMPGDNIAIDDLIGGAWYALNGDANGIAGDDLKVLIGQFTTTGEISGQIYCQVFINGNGQTEFRDTFFFGPDADVEGCMNPMACNYNADATIDDGSCVLPEDGYDCDGICLADTDGDGVCDPFEVEGCTDAEACNYDDTATDDNGSCTYADDGYDCAGNCLADADGDGICDPFEIGGCQDATACNYDATATDDDGSCEFSSCAGCLDDTACNYDADATIDDGSCAYPDAGLDCDGNCLADADGDGICDGDEIAGCQDDAACNYNDDATDDDGSCAYPDAGLDCDGNCLADADGDGICDGDEIAGCQDDDACNYSADATDDDGSCTYAGAGYDCDGNCLADADGDGICDGDDPCNEPDLTPAVLPVVPATYIAEVSLNGQSVTGMTVIATVNGETVGVDEAFDFEGASWVSMTLYVSPGETVEFTLFDPAACAEYDLDLEVTVTEEGEELATFDDPGDLPFLGDDAVLGCTDAAACNFNEDATVDDGSCELPADGLDCDGNCLADADGDGICDEDEMAGCTDDEACDFDPAATDDDGSCTYPVDIYGTDSVDCNGECLEDADGDGICDDEETSGCTDPEACNAGDFSDTDNSLCLYPVDVNGGIDYLDCDGNCLNDGDGDGVCDEDEVAGCQDDTACNYDETATDAGTCEYAEDGLDCDGNCLADADGDGICDGDEIAGCQDDTACNYDATATDDDGSCEYAEDGLDCDGNCLADADGDGICDEDEVGGCADAGACNFDAEATDDDGSCEYSSCAGCTDVDACNYDADATLDDGSCTFPEDGLDCDGNCLEDADGDGICDGDDPCNEPDMDVVVLPLIPNTLIADVTLDGMPIVGATVIATADGLVVGTGVTFDYEGASYVNMNLYLEANQTVALTLFDAANCALYDLDFDLIALEEGGDLGTFDDPAGLPYLSGEAIEGCMDEAACNYNENATIPGTCVYPEQYCGADYFNCDCECLNDADGDGICDEAEVPGCSDELACNYDADATDEDNSLCTYPAEDYLDCDGNCLSDADGDGLCDEEEVPGCTDENACNYAADATDEDGSCTYAEVGFDCNGDPLELDDCDPECIAFDPPVTDYTVECLDDLDGLNCESPTSALNTCTGAEYDEIACVSTPYNMPYSVGTATTAFGMGPDAAIRVYGLELAGMADSDYFIETGDGLSFTQFANGVAVLEGSVANQLNPNQSFDVFYVFEDRTSGADWAAMGKGFKYIYTCNDLPFDDWSIYMLKSDQSYLQGTGDFEGSLLQVNHAPANGYFGFQVGIGANDHNCEYGLGGWFAWEGHINGIEVNGALGDVITNLDFEDVVPTELDPCVTNIYTVIDDSCGAINVTQQVCRLDETAPLFDNCPADVTLSCNDALPEVPVLTATDNCDDPGSPVVTYLGETVVDQTSSACYTLQRTWSAIDLFDNETLCVQLIHVVDTEAPSIDLTLPGDLQISVSAMCETDLSTDMTGMAEAVFADNCAFASGDITYTDMVTDSTSAGCYTIERQWMATATDSCGNTSMDMGIQTIEIMDTQAPIITLSATQTEIACDDWNCDLDALVDLGLVSWTDNCGIDTAYIDCQSMSGGCVSPVPTWDVAYTVVDACGNSTTTHQFILMIDTVAPTIDITCPADVVVELDGDCQGELDPTQSGEVSITSIDNCDAAPTLSYTIEDTEPDYTCTDGTGTYVITRTFHAVSTDHCGNTAEASCTQVLTVVDVTAPVVTVLDCPADTAVVLDANCTAEFGTDLLGLPTVFAEDGCDIAPATFHYHVDGPANPLCDDSDGSADGSFSFERTFYAWSVDACGNVGDTVTCVQTITALDETAPEFGPFEPYQVASCEMLTDATDPTQVPLDVFDNCDADVAISIEAWPLSGVCPGSWMRIWTATDDCGNTTMAEQYISLYDEEAPVITCPSDTTLTLDMDVADDTTTVMLGLATAIDNCSSVEDIDIVWNDSDFMVDCEGDDDQPEGTMSFTRTFTAYDFCDNAASCEQTITLIDELGPMAEVSDVTLPCAEYDPAATYGEFSAMDNFDTDVAWSWVEDSVYNQTCAGAFMVDRTWTFVDDCGNSTDVHQTITVFDDVAPVVTFGDMLVEMSCEDYDDALTDDNILIDVEDACGSEVTITFFDTPFSGGCVQPVGIFMRTYTFEDDCGNANMFEQFIELYDDTPPVATITCPADTVLAADDACSADLSVEALGLADVVATDNCGGAAPDIEMSWTDHDTTTACAGSFSFTRTFTATAIDNCGNETTVSCSQSIGVADQTAPDFVEALPVDETVSCDAVPAAAVLTATDACDGMPTVDFTETQSDDDGCASNYTLLRTWTATDDCGNATTHQQTLTVVDETAPTWTVDLPTDTTVSCDAIPAAATLTASDNCDGDLDVIFNEGAAAGDCAQGQTLTRTWSTMDCAGNSLSHIQTITVVDTTAPVITGPLFLEVECGDWGMDTVYASVADNCDADIELQLLSEEEFSGSCAGSYLLTYIAVDACGNADTLIQSIDLTDTEAPVFTVIPQDTTLSCDDAFDVGSLGAAEAIDNCDADVDISYSDSTVFLNDCAGTAEIIRTWMAEDECGNNKTVEQLITLIDTTSPEFVEALPGDATVSCDAVPMPEILTATDNCDPAVFVQFSETQSDEDLCPNDFTLTRVWTVTDCAGNATSHTQLLTVVDTDAPVFTTGPLDAMVECDAVPAPADITALQANDNCDEALTYTYEGETFEDGDCANSYTLFREWSATDCSGNSTSWVQTLTVVDTQAPSLDVTFEDGTAAHDTTVSCLDEVPVLSASTIDACDGAPMLSASTDTLAIDGCGNATLAFHFESEDACGNMTSADFTVTVLDEIAPTWLDVCGIEDGGSIDVCAEDYTGGSLLPATDACDVSATDNCGGDVSIDMTTTMVGAYAPNDSVDQYCTSVTPEAFDADETCNGYDTHSVRLFNFLGDEFYSTVGEGLVSQLPNGDWMVEKTVVSNADPNSGWNVSFTLTDGMDFDTWSNQDFPTSYKQDCGNILDDHENWTYWFLSEGTLTGWGGYDGSFLTCTHQPANQFYRFQVGLGANNMNEHYGYSGWFNYAGTHMSTPVMGSGDFFGDLDCTLPYQIDYDYTATDCSGNAAEFGYTVNITGEVCDPDGIGAGLVGSGSTGTANMDVNASAMGEVRGPLQVSHIAPNPTQDYAQIGFNVLEPMRLEVSLYDASGMFIKSLFEGQVEKNQNYTLDIQAAALESGVYQVRMSSRNVTIVKQFLVTE